MNFLERKIGGLMLKKVVSNLAVYNGNAKNFLLTLVGIAAAWLLAADVHWDRVIVGDPVEIKRVGVAAVLAVLGWLAHFAPKPPVPPV